MKELVAQQRQFFNSHTTKDISFRIKQLTSLEDVLNDNIELLDRAIYNDFKKSSFENYMTEIGIVLYDIKQAKKKLTRWSSKQRVKTNLGNFPAKSYIIPEPLGVTLIISSWNYPYQLSLAPIVAAIAAGNTIILKPSEISSQTSGVMASILNEAFNPNFLKVIQGGVQETTELLKQKFDKIFFTGSTTVGKIIYKAAAEHLTPVTLELGGKSPVIITKDANIKMAAKRIVWGKFLNAGQTCIAPDYLYVDAQISETLLKALTKEIEKARYSFENDNYVQIINERNFDRLAALLDPSKIYYGGHTDKAQRYIAPTLLHDISFENPIMQEEIFGPILPVLTFTDLNEAVKNVQLLPKPLSCYVFTSSEQVKNKIIKEISFGGGAINDTIMHISNPNLPFGGVGSSGFGSYHGHAGFNCFSNFKSILDKPTWYESSLKYAPYTQKKLAIIKKLLKNQ
ncbi:MAG: aldehyde dehydrogenase [Bacteroidetes bacterium]|nr:aldehyde dehydrogenase [Bacteroidota bacterium]